MAKLGDAKRNTLTNKIWITPLKLKSIQINIQTILNSKIQKNVTAAGLIVYPFNPANNFNPDVYKRQVYTAFHIFQQNSAAYS